MSETRKYRRTTDEEKLRLFEYFKANRGVINDLALTRKELADEANKALGMDANREAIVSLAKLCGIKFVMRQPGRRKQADRIASIEERVTALEMALAKQEGGQS